LLARPDLAGFVGEVRRQAAAQAQGWVGDRKAYISHVWRALAQRRSDWRLSEIEFKCMLVEAHRAGQLALMHADLKDHKSIKDVQDSAVVYKNAVFHFVRVDG
jgi:trans-aconitate methyltransferase